jgi:hypothetical protein
MARTWPVKPSTTRLIQATHPVALLRTRGERPSARAAKQRDEVAPSKDEPKDEPPG